MICAYGEEAIFVASDACAGDSGGVLVEKDTNVSAYFSNRVTIVKLNVYYIGDQVAYGIVSWGHKACGQKGFPGVYTDIFHYKRWIERNMGL